MKNINVNRINSYIESCFMDAFRGEGRTYDPDGWDFSYVILSNPQISEYSYMVPLLERCKYQRVLRKVSYRLEKNIFKNFGIIYQPLLTKTHENMNGDEVNDEISATVELNTSRVDTNYTVAMIEMILPSSRRNITARLSVIPEYWDQIDPNKHIQLLMKCHDISYEEWCALDREDPKHRLPDKYYKWEEYLDLYQRTFNGKPWNGYQFIFSSVDDPIATFKVLDPLSVNDSENKED